MQINWDHVSTVGELVAAFSPFGITWTIWAIRWARRIETAVGLTKQVTDTHLPFVYGRLKVHDEALEIDSPEHPNIGLGLNGVKQRN